MAEQIGFSRGPGLTWIITNATRSLGYESPETSVIALPLRKKTLIIPPAISYLDTHIHSTPPPLPNKNGYSKGCIGTSRGDKPGCKKQNPKGSDRGLQYQMPSSSKKKLLFSKISSPVVNNNNVTLL